MQQIKLNEPETLPTDGTIVLLFLHDGTVCNAFFSNVSPTNDAKDDGEYDWVCCEDRFLLDGHDSHLIRGWLPLAYFEGYV
jgi:hypothetical protein